MFTRWGEQVDQVWVKRRVTGVPERDRGELFGATAATVERHPVPGLDPVNCTPQLGVPGLSATPGWRGACSAAPDRGAGRRVGLGLRRPGQ